MPRKSAAVNHGGQNSDKPVTQPAARIGFAQRLKMTREQRGYENAKDFADALGVQHETYRTWERPTREPDLTNLTKIAHKLDISLDFLILGHLPSFRTPKQTKNR